MSVLYAFGFNSCRQINPGLNADHISQPTILRYVECSRLSDSSFRRVYFMDEDLYFNTGETIIDVKISWNCIAALNTWNELLVWCDTRNGVPFNVPFRFTSICFGTTNILYNSHEQLLWMSTDNMRDCRQIKLMERRCNSEDGERLVEEVVECEEEFIDVQCCGDGSLFFLSKSNVLYQSERPAGLCEKSGKVTVVRAEYADRMFNLWTPKIIQVTCGKNHTLCLSDVCVVFSFGNGNQGQLGIGKWDFVMRPRMIDKLVGTKITKICAGGWHNLAISEDGDIYSWGWNRFGQVGLPFKDENEFDSWVDDGDNNNDDDKNIITDIACGARHSLCQSANGRVYSWGWNVFGQLGYDSEEESRWQPTEITFFRSFKSKRIYAGAWNSVVLVEGDYSSHLIERNSSL
ncbi:hypothetical protein HELRODRAFT_99528 [Helobdella robusta]|uniref:SRCR domain-containing protein n=1 Tax=Helobdella robusta TaxID=6412 RepID=T1G9T3_HELRO|nr:hypothetical protein HELRODRAFT_99528 [Helobdella robusta]ESO04641.1 hypothetical protein HELRODRAFT_99528 [Helobdella robusta]